MKEQLLQAKEKVVCAQEKVVHAQEEVVRLELEISELEVFSELVHIGVSEEVAWAAAHGQTPVADAIQSIRQWPSQYLLSSKPFKILHYKNKQLTGKCASLNVNLLHKVFQELVAKGVKEEDARAAAHGQCSAVAMAIQSIGQGDNGTVMGPRNDGEASDKDLLQ